MEIKIYNDAVELGSVAADFCADLLNQAIATYWPELPTNSSMGSTQPSQAYQSTEPKSAQIPS